MSSLDVYAYLWDGSDPGWELLWTSRVTWRVRVLFDGPWPARHELRKLRKLVPALGSLPARDCARALEGCTHYAYPESVGNIERGSILEHARALGLRTDVAVEDRSSGLPVRNDEVLIIEDGELARQVCERMKAEGVPVRLAELD